MKRPLVALGLAVSLMIFCCASRGAEAHRATWLGNPATRFAPPLHTPEDLRARFRDEALKPDFASVLRQWRWTGNIEDLFRAALTNEIVEWKIPVGSTMPFMSTRKNGHPICLINVLWAGKEPAPAYAFLFSSRGIRYRCVTPKACSNFFLEELGPEPKPVLAIECSAPAEVPKGRPAETCLTIRNTGDAADPKVTVTLPIAPEAIVTDTTEGGVYADGRVTWVIPAFESNAVKQVCATIAMRQLGEMAFAPSASGEVAKRVPTSCATKIIGIPAILLEVIDLDDPIEVGKEVTYEIKVTNQGTAPDTNIRIVCTLDPSQEFVSCVGATPAQAQGRVVTIDLLPMLEPKAVVSWHVMVKAAAPEDVRFKVELRSDQFERPITEDESTRQYQ